MSFFFQKTALRRRKKRHQYYLDYFRKLCFLAVLSGVATVEARQKGRHDGVYHDNAKNKHLCLLTTSYTESFFATTCIVKFEFSSIFWFVTICATSSACLQCI